MHQRMAVLLVVTVAMASTTMWLTAQQPPRGVGNQIAIDPDDIAGVVTSSRGPEAGVWVIAETTDMPTKFRKIVVTDDQGRYLLPDLPAKATFNVWVRGYGLVDSAPVRATPGGRLRSDRRTAPDAARGRASTRRTTGTR